MKRQSTLFLALAFAAAVAAQAAGPRRPPPRKGAPKPKPSYESAKRAVDKARDDYEDGKRECGRSYSNLGSYTGAGGLKDEKKLHDLRVAKDRACGGNDAMDYIHALSKAIDLGQDEIRELEDDLRKASPADKPQVQKELEETRREVSGFSSKRQQLRSMHTSNPRKR